MLKELSSDIIPLLSRFDAFDIEGRIVDQPSADINSLNSISGNSLFGKNAFAPNREVPSLLDLFGDPEEEYWEARRQRDEAKWFYEDMKYQKEKLKNIKEKMRIIRFFIDDERKMLDGLNEKLQKISKDLTLGLNKSRFSKPEADYLKSIHHIGLKISDLLTIKFLDEDLKITTQYQQSFNQMQIINNNLQMAPEISNSDDALKKLLELLDTTVHK